MLATLAAVAPGPDTDSRPAERAGAAGRVLALLSVVPALAVAGWLATAVPLLALGLLRPLPAILIGLPAAVAAAWWGSRAVPARPSPWWPVAALLVLAAGLAALSAAMHAEQVVLRRDPGAYALTGQWLGEHGRKQVPVDAEAFGAARDDVDFASPAFYRDGDVLRPQFMSGLPSTLAVGWWLGGWTGLLVVPALCAGFAVLAAGGLAARLVGPRWAVLAAGSLALAQPVLHVARSTYSEPLAQLLLVAGLCFVVDALSGRVSDVATRALAATGGVLLGIATVVRVDALREILLAVPLVGILAAYRHPAARPLGAGLAAGCAFGLFDGIVLSWPYISDIGGSLLPLLGGGALLAGVTAALVYRIRRTAGASPSLPARAPAVAATGVVALGLLLAGRPLLGEARTDPGSPGARTVAGIQERAGMPVDGGRTYYEQSVSWVSWYVGWPTLALALAAAAVLAFRAVRGAAPGWGAVLLIGAGSAGLTFLRPEITPDHPWADRRLVPVLLPVVTLLAAAAVATSVRALRARPGPHGRHFRGGAAVAVGMVGCAAILLPTAAGSAALLAVRTEQGQIAAVEQACESLTADDVVLLVDRRAQLEWPAALRHLCGVPVASLTPGADASRVATAIAAAGGRPVLATARSPEPLRALGLSPAHVVALATTEDARVLTERPGRAVPLRVDLWIARPTTAG